ncbi:VOC family protein [Haliscomenobacter sp.]|uniref:VOC family protein n=1 Tax=Haliscomenobacter sp. TaxID=2717303 RepID=UPI003BAD343D
MQNKIYPCLWFDGQAKAAAEFYCSVFGDGKITTNSGMVVNFELSGQKFMGLNGGPQFKINPSISFYVVCESEAEIDATWTQLSNGGMVMMPLGKYAWSEKYGWLQDQYGVSWQLTLGKLEDVGQKFTPLIMFANEQFGKAEAAINAYSSLFPESSLVGIARFEEGEPSPGMIKHAQFKLHDQVFMVMDAPGTHNFNFNEGLSLVVDCQGQEEVDHYWNGFTAKGEESMCAWLKDEFGVSWQIVPRELMFALADPDPDAAQYAMNALFQMRKIEIAKLKRPTVITVRNTVKVPVEKAWKHWTTPEHIMQWNNASDDWHTPKAENDLRPGGRFVYTMAARDGSMSFDFGGTFDEVRPNERLTYTIDDGRKVEVTFKENGQSTEVIEAFEAENIHSHELQEAGWQAILDNFKKHVEQ